MKYVIYLRVSTDQQTQSGLGIEAQRQMCLLYITTAGTPQSVLEYMDEGFSGSLALDKRPALLRPLPVLPYGHNSGLIFYCCVANGWIEGSLG